MGLAFSVLAAIVLIGVFLVMTEEQPDDSSAARRPATGRVVRIRSPQVPELAWSSARGEFRIRCRRGRLVTLEARITALPPDHRYTWAVITGDAGETDPLDSRPGMTAELLEGDGTPEAVTPVDGAATVRFTFVGGPAVPGEPLGLEVLDVPRLDAFVLATPRRPCR